MFDNVLKPCSMHETIERYRKHTKDVQSNNTPVAQNMQVFHPFNNLISHTFVHTDTMFVFVYIEHTRVC